MNNDMQNTVENRRKYVQFIAQEVSRFWLMPFTREVCEEIIDEGRRRSNKKEALSKVSSHDLFGEDSRHTGNERGFELVEKRHVREAIEKHCKTIQKQILEHQMSERGELLEISPEGAKLGQIYGVAVVKDSYSGEMTGNVLTVKGFLEKRDKRYDNRLKGY